MTVYCEEKGFNPHKVNEEAIKPIAEYCYNRDFKCKGCRYNIDFITKEHSKYSTCIFANCPCDWEVK